MSRQVTVKTPASIAVSLSSSEVRRTVQAAHVRRQTAGVFVTQAIDRAVRNGRDPSGQFTAGNRARTPRADAPARPFTVRLSPAEHARAVAAAAANHQRPSEFVRDAIVTAAEDCLDPLP